jgi:hypothetical protein
MQKLMTLPAGAISPSKVLCEKFLDYEETAAMTFEMETTQKFVCRTNIVKYEKMLATRLTSVERHYVELRLSEERAALRQLNRSVLDKELRPFVQAR